MNPRGRGRNRRVDVMRWVRVRWAAAAVLAFGMALVGCSIRGRPKVWIERTEDKERVVIERDRR